MKKEKIYSSVYGLVLLFTLVATSMMGQYAYTSISNPSEFELENTSVISAEKVTAINTSAINTISNHLKKKISLVNKRIGIDEKGTWIVEVVISKEGFIKKSEVSRDDNVGTLIKNYLNEIEKVEPITYNGIAKERTIRIPIIL